MSEFHRLRTYLERRATFTEEEFAFLEPLFLQRMLRAGEFLQRAGELVTHGAFVATGCLRKYIIDAKGKEHIVQFAPENWWVGEGPGAASGTLAEYSIDAVENSTVLLFDAASIADPSDWFLLRFVMDTVEATEPADLPEPTVHEVVDFLSRRASVLAYDFSEAEWPTFRKKVQERKRAQNAFMVRLLRR